MEIFLQKFVSGQCIRINTGAPVPAGADAVVQVEDTRLVRASDNGKTELEIEILYPPSPGQDIRPVGSDISLGSKVLSAKSRLGAAEVGLLAAVGAVEVEVFKLPKVALLSTGDEVKRMPIPEFLIHNVTFCKNIFFVLDNYVLMIMLCKVKMIFIWERKKNLSGFANTFNCFCFKDPRSILRS